MFQIHCSSCLSFPLPSGSKGPQGMVGSYQPTVIQSVKVDTCSNRCS